MFEKTRRKNINMSYFHAIECKYLTIINIKSNVEICMLACRKLTLVWVELALLLLTLFTRDFIC
uniref:Uncharacterized protein n=2 Tax=Anguilla anguilla TaxID=7936 RepID=A0A0E9TK48_ANGAN